MNQKSIIFIGIALILLIGGILVWKETVKAPIDDGVATTQPTAPTVPTQTPTTPQNHKIPEGWKTYENKEFGFAFDYPGDWELEEFRTKKGENNPYSFYEIRLWAPDQLDDKKRIDSRYLNDHFADPRILIYADNENKGEEIEKQLRQKIGPYQKNGATVKLINLPTGIKAYLIEKSTNEELLIIALNGMMITFNSGLGIPLRMDIVRTFRFYNTLTSYDNLELP